LQVRILLGPLFFTFTTTFTYARQVQQTSRYPGALIHMVSTYGSNRPDHYSRRLGIVGSLPQINRVKDALKALVLLVLNGRRC